MNLTDSNIILTGASGGIGRVLAMALAIRGAKLALVGLNGSGLGQLAAELRQLGAVAEPIRFDLGAEQGQDEMIEQAADALGGVDVLINNAGVMNFGAFSAESPESISTLVKVNIQGPMLLTRALLPRLIAQGHGRIVNVGSIFGSIGFAWFTSYSTSKFASRGFSEALRRELEGTGVGVTYVAPRATRTPINNSAIMRMAQAVGMKFDEPQWVANKILQAIEADVKDRYLGFPERLFVGINSLLPRLIDSALRKQNRTARKFAPGA